MMPNESNMKSMLMALSNGVKDPKMADMMGKLLESCMKHHQKGISTGMGMSDADVPKMNMNPSLGSTI
jgi:hypothetical protein